MTVLHRLASIVRWMVHRDRAERDLSDELQAFVELAAADRMRDGAAPDEAQRLAVLHLGGVEQAKERVRSGRYGAWLDEVGRDIRHSVRMASRNPGFTLVSSLTLAEGIGAATAVFSVVNAVLIKPLPYPDSEALVSIWHAAPGANIPEGVPMATTHLFTYRDESRVFEEIGLWSTGVASLTGVGQPEEVRMLLVTHGTLKALGVRPAIGRGFSPEDDSQGSPDTVILSYGYWQRRHVGDASIVGRSLAIEARPRQVIGVMPSSFRFLNADVDIILPFQFNRSNLFLRKPAYGGIARLKPGVTLAQANADVARMIPMWLEAWPAPPGIDPQIFENARFAPALRPLKQDVVGDVGRVLWVLMGTVGIVLLIACANVANLMLVRAEGRQRELAVRAALGAGWGRLARQMLLESTTLALLGGVLGVALAFFGVRLLVSAQPTGLPRLGEITIDPMVLAFTLIVSLLCGLVFGLVPVARYAGPRVARGLQSGGRTSSQRAKSGIERGTRSWSSRWRSRSFCWSRPGS